MKKYVVYGAIVAVLVLTVWALTRGGMKSDPQYSIASEDVAQIRFTVVSPNGGQAAEIDGPEDIQKLTDTLNTLIGENGISMEEEDIELGNSHARLEWLSPAGEALAVVDISETGKVYREEYCFNYIGGEIFDQEYLSALLLKYAVEAETPAPIPTTDLGERPLDPKDISRVVLNGSGSYKDKSAALKGNNLERLSASFRYAAPRRRCC